MCKGIYYNRCLYFLKWSILVASLTSTWHMKSANNLETLNRSHMIFLPFFNAFNCCVLLSKFPFDHKQSTLNIIQNSLFSTTISSWHTKKKGCLRGFPFQMSEWIHTLVDTRSCPSNRIDPFMAASSMNIFAHIVKFVCECVCCLFMNPLQNGQR